MLSRAAQSGNRGAQQLRPTGPVNRHGQDRERTQAGRSKIHQDNRTATGSRPRSRLIRILEKHRLQSFSGAPDRSRFRKRPPAWKSNVNPHEF